MRDPSLTVIVPSRGRPGNIADLWEAWKEKTALPTTRLVVAYDLDDPCIAEYEKVCGKMYGESTAVITVRTSDYKNSPNFRLSEILNVTSRRLVSEQMGFIMAKPFAIGFMGDDHRPRTKGWDEIILTELQKMQTGIVYGNDLIQGENLPTAVAMTSDIIETLGYMAPPNMKHMWLDNYWKELGQQTGILRYRPDVIIEHLHPIAGRAPWDDGYLAVNTLMQSDKDAWDAYVLADLEADVEKVRRILF